MVTARPCFVGARGVDSLSFSQSGTPSEALVLKATGIDFVALYLGVAGKAQADAALAAGLLIFGVTVANAYDGASAVSHAKTLGLPPGTSLFLDVEGMAAYNTPAPELIAKINAWAQVVSAAGYVPGIYVASPQPLTTDELTNLAVVRYWRAPARIVDRNGQLAEPRSGWCVVQAWPSRSWSGVWVDVDFVTQDFKGRTPAMAGTITRT